LQDDIDAARKVGTHQADRQSGPEGEIRIQPSSKVLIVSGSDDFIEMVESVVAAHRTNAEIEAVRGSRAEEREK
jgi:type II secretory pathway component GspD/PulD (secretin)